jgi:hypothetical protein
MRSTVARELRDGGEETGMAAFFLDLHKRKPASDVETHRCLLIHCGCIMICDKELRMRKDVHNTANQ